MRSFYILIIAILGLQSATAQDSLLTREAAIEITLENNFGIAIAKNQVAIADNNQSILNSGFLPVLTASGGANYNRDDSVIEFPGQFLENGDPRPLLSTTLRSRLELSNSCRAFKRLILSFVASTLAFNTSSFVFCPYSKA